VRCPQCHSMEDKVLDSRMNRDGTLIRRRRECLVCGHRFTTYERIEDSMLLIIKKDGRREPYSREKLSVGIRKAFEKRPVSVQIQEELANKVERFLLSQGTKEVPSSLVGEKVMSLIREVDDVAYVRFASVYRQFKCISDFWEELRSLTPKETSSKKKRRSPTATDARSKRDHKKGKTKPSKDLHPSLPLEDVEDESDQEEP